MDVVDAGDVVDVVVIGGGIAGVSAAAHLAERGASVILIEREPHLAMHTTGRSAAQYLENYGGPTNVALTLASREEFVAGGFLSPRALLTVGGESELPALEALAEEGARQVSTICLVEGEEAQRLCPALRADRVAAAVLEPDAADIDVAALHQHYVRTARAHGARIDVGVTDLPERDGARWRVGDRRCAWVVNAAGAWADEVAAAAAVAPVGLRPLRRTAFITPAPPGSEGWPLVYFVDDRGYFKPEPGQNLLCSPADEIPSDPCDAKPEELDVARTIDLLNEVTTLELRHVRRAWAGLRTFSPDRDPVIGPDPDVPGFCWMAGQGGTGIQAAPALGRAVAGLVLDGRLPADLAARGLDLERLGPGRLGPGRLGPGRIRPGADR